MSQDEETGTRGMRSGQSHSEAAEDVTTSQGAPVPGQRSLHPKEDQILPQESPTIRALEAADRSHHHLTTPPKEELLQNPIFLQEPNTNPKEKGEIILN